MSSEGVQQGDPLGLLLFCLTIHELTSQLESDLCMFYLDDGTLGGSPEGVFRDLQLVQQGAATLGLSLNHKKSEVISHNPVARETLLTTAPDLSVTNPDCACLLGSPLGDVECISRTIQEKTASLRTMPSYSSATLSLSQSSCTLCGQPPVSYHMSSEPTMTC